MLTFGMVTLFGAYGVSSYGWCLLQGYNIPFRAWWSPLHPYQWPKGGPELIPPDRLFPSSKSPFDSSLGAQVAQGVKNAV